MVIQILMQGFIFFSEVSLLNFLFWSGLCGKQEYNPERMDTFHDYQGHQGTGLLTFKNDIHGLEDAQAFDQNFAAIGRGRKEWFDENRPANLDLYGWQATEEVHIFFVILVVSRL